MSEPTILLRSRKFYVERVAFRSHEYDVIRHAGAAVILPVLADGRVVLLENQRAAVGGPLLELPAGTLDPPESPAACAARELREETGYSAGRLEPLLQFFSAPGFCTELLHAFLATELRPGAHQREATEEMELVEWPLTAALEAVRTNRIRDAKTIAVLLYYAAYVHAGA